MSKTSNVGDLMARLQQKIEQDRIEIEAVTQSELKKLADNLRQSVKDESYIIVRDIKEHTRWMNAVLWGSMHLRWRFHPTDALSRSRLSTLITSRISTSAAQTRKLRNSPERRTPRLPSKSLMSFSEELNRLVLFLDLSHCSRCLRRNSGRKTIIHQRFEIFSCL